jgi:hypothetical protein
MPEAGRQSLYFLARDDGENERARFYPAPYFSHEIIQRLRLYRKDYNIGARYNFRITGGGKNAKLPFKHVEPCLADIAYGNILRLRQSIFYDSSGYGMPHIAPADKGYFQIIQLRLLFPSSSFLAPCGRGLR